MAGSDTWWADEPVDWINRPEPAKVRDILKSAYPSRDAMVALASKAGLPPAMDDGSGDDPWKWAIDVAVTGGWFVAMCKAVLADPEKGTFHLKINELLYPDWDETAGLQTINAPGLGLVDALMDERVAIDSRRRTAMVEIGGKPRGTGFLVGPDLLLTAAHVIDRSHFPPQPPGAVVAVFDFQPQAGLARADTGARARVTEAGLGLAGSLPTGSERNDKPDDWDAATDEFLDFVLMRLERDVSKDLEYGLPRGFYHLQPDSYAFANSDILRIAQHPLGQTTQVARAVGPFLSNKHKTRVRYVTNTLPGSSGSAVVDANGRLVALHHFGGSRFNQGILIDRIAAHIEAKLPLPGLAALPLAAPAAVAPAPAGPAVPPAIEVNGPDPFETLGFGMAPFAGRSALRSTIKSMLSGNDQRILLLEGGQDVGKTYSHRFLTHLRARQEHPAVKKLVKGGLRVANVDLDWYVNVPRANLHEKILESISGSLGLDADKKLAQPPRLVTDLVNLLQGTSLDNGAVLWIFFDSLDRHNLEEGQVRELIASLLQLVESDEAIPVRLVLSSRPPAPVPQELVQWAQREKPEGLSRDEVKDWLTGRAREKGQELDDAKLAAKLNELFPPGPNPSARSLAPALPRTLNELLGTPA